MSRVIYIDELIVINLFVNYFLLLVTAKILRAPFNRLRILLACALGGVYSISIFINSLNPLVSIAMKVAMSSSIVLVAYKIKNLKSFFRSFAAFLGANFIFAGLMFALWIAAKPKGMVFNNGTVYFNINMAVLCVSVIVSYVLISVALKLLKKKAPSNRIYTTAIEIFGKKVVSSALYDTGNTLRDGFSGSPVIVAQYNLVKDLFPNELKEFFKSGNLSASSIPENWSARIRMIPFNSVKCKGLLPAFKPDNVTVKCEESEETENNVFVAVTNQALSNGEYSILLNGLMLENNGGEEHEKFFSHF